MASVSESALRVFGRIPKAAVVGVLVTLASFPLLAQQPAVPRPLQYPEKTSPNIILISVDTLRSDHVSSYSLAAAPTPNIDNFSHGGTLFSQASSMVPLTLPSHVSMLTSTYAFVSGVEDNGEQLAPHTVTLASTLRSHGYRTAAFLGGFVLDRQFGLNQGFETYDSPAVSSSIGSTDPGDIKRKGEVVVNNAEEWLQNNSKRAFFLFVHIYDLHTPYNLSVEERAKYGEGYSGELAYIDHVIGGFWDYLVTRDLVNNSVIVFTSDHGEALGEHEESTHGFFVYQSTLHVPLIIHWPRAKALLPARVDAPTSLLDISPTILNAVRLPIPKTMEGSSLLAPGEVPRDVYSESVYPQKHFDASALASLRLGHYKYIEAPKPEFYDLSDDPGETTNLYTSKASLASAYAERLKQLREKYQPRGAGKPDALSPETIERLHALGYLTVADSVASSKPSGVDPKDRIADYEAYGRALYQTSVGQLEQSSATLKKILLRDEGLADVRLALGLNEQRMGQDADALEQFRTVLGVQPANALAHLDAGLSCYNLRLFEEAAKELNAALAISPGYVKAEIWLAKTMAKRGDLDGSAAEFNQVLLEAPDSYEAHDGLGTLEAMRGNWDESERQLQAAIALEPAAAETYTTLGGVYLRVGKTDQARIEFKEALRLNPKYASAHYNLGLLFVQEKDLANAKREFQKALSADPQYLPAKEALTRLDQQ